VALVSHIHDPAAVRRRAVIALITAAVIAAGAALIQSAGNEGPPPVSGTPAEVVAVVDSFDKALATRDFATICDRLFTVRAREAAGGDNCQSVLTQAASRLRVPRVRITSVVLSRGGKATVGVLASTSGARPAPDVIRLVRRHGRFRIASAGVRTRRGDDQ
jgi:hypothetical protein